MQGNEQMAQKRDYLEHKQLIEDRIRELRELLTKVSVANQKRILSHIEAGQQVLRVLEERLQATKDSFLH